MNSVAELAPCDLAEMRRISQDNGLSIRSIHPFSALFEGLYFFSGYPRRISDGLDLYRRFFAAGAELGAKYVVFHGEKLTPTFSRPLASDDEVMTSYTRLIQTAREEGLIFTQENVAYFRSQDPMFLRNLADCVPDIRFTFDLKQAMRANIPVDDVLAAMGERLVHIHINDFSQKTECALPFQGEVDLPALAHKLKEMHYQGDFILEVYRTNFTSDSELSDAASTWAALVEETERSHPC